MAVGRGQLPLAIGVLLVLSGASTVGVAAAQPAGGAKDPLQLFQPLVPVYTSPRCINCHGGVNVVSGDGHEGGAIDDVVLDAQGDMRPGRVSNQPCLGCHDEAASAAKNDDGTDLLDDNGIKIMDGPWRLAPKVMSFVGKDALALCQMQRETNALVDEDPVAFDAYLRHLGGDPLIGMAFEGKRGITDSSPEGPVTAEPPPMERATFVQLARRWLDEGKGHCTPWTGTITQTTTKKIVTRLTEDVANATVTITLNKSGDASAHVHMTGHLYGSGQACEMRHDTFAADGDVSAEVNILLNNQLNLPSAPSVALPPGVTNPLSGNGYTIIIRTPEVAGTDKWEQRDAPGCALKSGTNPYTFLAAGGTVNKQIDPRNPGHLKDQDKQGSGDNTTVLQWDLRRD